MNKREVLELLEEVITGTFEMLPNANDNTIGYYKILHKIDRMLEELKDE